MAAKAKTRAKGEGSLEKHGKVWRAKWIVNGKTYTRSTGTGVKRLAEKKLKEFVTPFKAQSDVERLASFAAKIECQQSKIRKLGPGIPLEDGFEEYRSLPRKHNGRKRKPTGEDTLRMYACQYNRLVEWARANAPTVKQMCDITDEVALRFRNHLKTIVSENTQSKYMTLFTHIWEMLQEKAKLTSNPWQKLDTAPPSTDSVRRSLSAAELLRVIEPLTGEMRLLFALGLFTGLRLGDCARLQWNNVDLNSGFIFVKPHKTSGTGTHVNLPIHPNLARLLSLTPPADRVGFVLPGIAYEYNRNSSLVTARIQKAFRSAGIETQDRSQGRARVVVGFHSLRHTFVSMTGNAGIPLAVVKSLVGHVSPMMTEKYFHPSKQMLQAAVNAIPTIDVEFHETTSSEEANSPDKENFTRERINSLISIINNMTIHELEIARNEIDKKIASARK